MAHLQNMGFSISEIDNRVLLMFTFYERLNNKMVEMYGDSLESSQSVELRQRRRVIDSYLQFLEAENWNDLSLSMLDL